MIKKIRRIISVILLAIIINLSIGNIVLNADESEYVAIEKTSGDGYITYRGTSTKVMIPTNYTEKSYEYRAVWVSPLTNDIGTFSTISQYKNEILNVFQVMEYYNLNVLIFHVRIMNDALYQSKYNRWSVYYNQNPNWDALPWIIEECHKRGIEFHAWMNPYRVTTNTSLSDSDICKNFNSNNPARFPEYLLRGSGYVILNPGEPIVRNFLVNTCLELMENYDIDAINFDDYFYVSGIDDSATMLKYNNTGLSKGDWRREQVNMFIEKLSIAMREFNQKNNRRVQLGVAPAGIWKSGDGVVSYSQDGTAITTGSNTSPGAFQNYGEYLYADVKKWVDNEWVDYILPQTYWALEHSACAYADLVSWWDKVVKYKKVNLYVALALYQRTNSDGSSWYTNDYEGYNEVMFDNMMENVKGLAVYDFKSLRIAMNNESSFKDVEKLWEYSKILPEIRTMQKIDIGTVKNIKINTTSAGYKISFDKLDGAKFYVIYRSKDQITYSPKEVIKVIGNVSDGAINEYIDEVDTNENYYYAVRAQSLSLTLGQGAIISTDSATPGDLVDFGSFDEIIVDENRYLTETVNIRFSNMYYPFGGKMNYKLSYSYDNNKWYEVTTFSNQRNLNTYGVYIPEGTSKVYFKIYCSNNLGSTKTDIQSFDIQENLPEITGFDYLGKAYTEGKIKFVWNNYVFGDGIKYTLQTSNDTLTWNNIYTEENGTGTYSLYEYTLPIEAGVYYYRILTEHNGLTGISKVLSVSLKKPLDEIKDFTVNSEPLEDKYLFVDGDEVIINWKKSAFTSENVNYTVRISSDLTNWITAKTYNSSSKYSEENNYCTQILALNNYSYKIYVSVTGQSTTREGEQIIFPIYIVPEFFYYDEITSFLVTDQKTAIKEANLFN